MYIVIILYIFFLFCRIHLFLMRLILKMDFLFYLGMKIKMIKNCF